MQVHLETFEDYFGEERDLADIEPREIENHRVHLFTLPNGRSGTLSSQSVAAEESRISKLECALGKRRGPKPDESVEELMKPTSETEMVVTPLRSKILRHTYTTARIQSEGSAGLELRPNQRNLVGCVRRVG